MKNIFPYLHTTVYYWKIFSPTCMSAARESVVSAMTMWALLGQAVGLKGEGGSRIIWTI